MLSNGTKIEEKFNGPPKGIKLYHDKAKADDELSIRHNRFSAVKDYLRFVEVHIPSTEHHPRIECTFKNYTFIDEPTFDCGMGLSWVYLQCLCLLSLIFYVT